MGRRKSRSRWIDLAGGAVAVAPDRRQPKGVVHFLGGAFAGAAPYLAYSLLIDQLADDGGYTVITTPYAVTFRHDDCARAVHAAFLSAVDELRASPAHGWAAPPGAALHGVGHSNGALLHLLMGSLCPPYASAALVSFNNRAVSDAVPLPLQPAQAAVEALRSAGGGRRLEQAASSAAQQAVSALLGAASAAGLADAGVQRGLRELAPALAQLGSVFDEVGDGQLDFTPSPEATRSIAAAQYAVPRTLLVRFRDDGIDQTPELLQLLQRRRGSGNGGGGSDVSELVLAGSHVTPLGAAPYWRAGAAFSPVDAVAQAALALAQGDTRRLAGRLLTWLDLAGAR